ncbi:MAG: isoprenyl transferase [Acidobacteriota bacterium]
MGKADLEGYIEPGSEAEALLAQLNLERLPRHVAIIMDGNGRWARRRRQPRIAGHRAGIRAVRDTVETAARLGLEVLTLYAFSRENWKRPKSEVETLMELLQEYLARELSTLMAHDVRFNVIGRAQELNPSVQQSLRSGMDLTAANRGLLFNIALSYSGRTEIVDAAAAAQRYLEKPENRGKILDEELLAAHLYTRGQPDPDLLIRTSGELRVSNFLLWQIAYAEIWVTDVLWPEFSRTELLHALVDFQKRERRYGAVDPLDHGESPRCDDVMVRTR